MLPELIQKEFHLLNCLNNVVFLADSLSGKILFINKAAENILGYNHKQMKGMLAWELVLPQHMADKWPKYVALVSEKGEYRFRSAVYTKKKTKLHIEVFLRNCEYENETVIFAEIKDISNQKRIEDLLDSSEEYYLTLTNYSFQGLSIFDKEGIYQYTSPTTLSILGFEEKDVIGKSIFDFIKYEHVEECQAMLQRSLASPKEVFSFQTVLHGKKQHEINVAAYIVNLLENPVIEGIVSWFIDISDIVRTRERINKQKIYLQKLINAVPVMVWAKDWDGRYTLANEAFCTLVGINAKKVLGKTDSELNITTQQNQEKTTEEERLIMINAEPSSPVERLMIRPNSSEKRWLMTYKAPLIMDSHLEIIGVATEVTNLKTTEERLSHTNRELMEVNQELDRFIYSASHELRTPLTSAIGMLQLLREEDEPEAVKEYIPLMYRALNRLDNILRNLIRFSNNEKNEVRKELIDFGTLIAEAAEKLKNSISLPNLHFDCIIRQGSSFYSDTRRLSQVIQILFSNAITYLDDDKKFPEVLFRVTSDDEKAIIEVEDNGIGIDEQFREKIFQMFFRATNKGAGAGLGLYIAHNIVGKLQGTLSVDSEPGKGSTFRLEIPNLAKK